jgi:hypothetical protein
LKIAAHFSSRRVPLYEDFFSTETLSTALFFFGEVLSAKNCSTECFSPRRSSLFGEVLHEELLSAEFISSIYNNFIIIIIILILKTVPVAFAATSELL